LNEEVGAGQMDEVTSINVKPLYPPFFSRAFHLAAKNQKWQYMHQKRQNAAGQSSHTLALDR